MISESTPKPLVTIGFIPRERFSRAADALRRLIECTDIDYRLLVVDCNTPPRYLREIESVIAGRDNAEIVHSDRYLMPNESRRLLTPLFETEFACIIENDCFVEPGWLTNLIDALRTFEATVAAPLLYEYGRYHGDSVLGNFHRRAVPAGTRLEFAPIGGKHEAGPTQLVQSVESHCLLFRSEFLRRHDVFDESLTTHDFLDISLALAAAGAPIVFEPRARLSLDYPPRVEPDEQAYYRLRWDLDTDRRSADRVRRKWGFAEIVSARGFARERLHRQSWLQLSLYTLRVRAWRRLRTQFRRIVLRRPPNELLEYERGPLPDDAARLTTDKIHLPIS